ncbi:diacylglycerol kinase catalytic domain-containing protein [Ditylenchus destructor]|uniref:Diacylglycerol kinase catalytic domain-containing protein n=1 Tax=Ditylenchus destructor TaxID=166010 RepID=A0AAD4NHD4_9BILA|nr:diacylglycerol kinase catalytic domain-containing protein [Ditylenchus destructor]
MVLKHLIITIDKGKYKWKNGNTAFKNEQADFQIEPLLDLVGVQRQVIETERANHAFDLIKEMDAREWTSYDGLISVGGDRLFNEVLSSAVDRQTL